MSTESVQTVTAVRSDRRVGAPSVGSPLPALSLGLLSPRVGPANG